MSSVLSLHHVGNLSLMNHLLCFQENHVGAREVRSWALHDIQQWPSMVQRTVREHPLGRKWIVPFTSKKESPFVSFWTDTHFSCSSTIIFFLHSPFCWMIEFYFHLKGLEKLLRNKTCISNSEKLHFDSLASSCLYYHYINYSNSYFILVKNLW